jgi:glycyl-tRNA synthetase (class II)
MVRFRMTLSTRAQGYAYIPVTIETGTGVARCFVAVVATP